MGDWDALRRDLAKAGAVLRVGCCHATLDVLPTNVVMPDASGPELTKQLVERRSALKVIYMSGYTEEALGHYAALNDGAAFLQKPFSSEILGRTVRNVLAGSHTNP